MTTLSRHNPGPEPPLEPALALTELAGILHEEASLPEVLGRIAELARRVIPCVAEASVTEVEDEEARTVVFTGGLAAFLDERQYARGFGPCVDAAISGGTIVVDTRDRSGPYPEFAAVAAARGVRRVLSVGLPVARRSVGALNLYVTAAPPIPEPSLRLAETFAGYAAVAVANAVLFESAVEQAEHMRAAMRSRAVIEQAKGILMTTHHCDAEQAFFLLTRASQQQNRKLRDVAARVVAGVGGSGGVPRPSRTA